jgi:hypothetical protein
VASRAIEMLPFFLKKSASQESLAWMYRYQASL